MLPKSGKTTFSGAVLAGDLILQGGLVLGPEHLLGLQHLLTLLSVPLLSAVWHLSISAFSFASTWTNKDMEAGMRVDDHLLSKRVTMGCLAFCPADV